MNWLFLAVYFDFSRNKDRMLIQMLSAEAFVGPCAQRTQQVWRPKLGRQTCCEGPGQARTFAIAGASMDQLGVLPV